MDDREEPWVYVWFLSSPTSTGKNNVDNQMMSLVIALQHPVVGPLSWALV
jgi:hypothetical protein